MLNHTWREYRRGVLNHAEKAYLAAVMRQTRGAVKEAAALAGFSARALHQKLRAQGLSPASFR